MGPGGLLSASPDSHRIRKKLLLQALAPVALQGHVPRIQKLVRSHILDWCNKGEQLGTNICKRLAMSVAANILIGFDVNDQNLQSIISSFQTFTGNLFSLSWELPGSGLSKDYQIPEGWSVIYSIRDTYQTTKLFEDREEFQPERWNEMDKETRLSGQRFDYIPFGAGARACPGEKFARMFLKIFIVELIKTCTWVLKNKNPKSSYFPVTKPSHNLPVTFHLREDLDKDVSRDKL